MTSIIDTLSSLTSAAEEDDAFILAASINLYNENIRRREGRILYGPNDVRALFEIMKVMVSDKVRTPIRHSRTAAPTTEEKEMITDVGAAIQQEVDKVPRGVILNDDIARSESVDRRF